MTVSALPHHCRFIHDLCQHALYDGAWAVDATVGNGHDTVVLATAVGPSGQVFGFDLQAVAIKATRTRLETVGLADRVALFQQGHETLEEVLPPSGKGRIQVAVFNFGYLPGGDKAVITTPRTSLLAIAQAFDWLAPNGLLLLTLYPGHPGGDKEAVAIRQWTATLDPQLARTMGYQGMNAPATAPFVIAVEKIAGG